ncbi:hypothetical protein [Croceitalea vernalis]|uniref:TonB C-terminal domain-containing protein n=1 Tax=Croceitalea vernalis TaxID=3075599 RepID=A0ABU3BFF2_9FLAO|nr:hypothetical protein [Croceitalea sp. P007]MDT0620900.1 hypothetical protein [Croceitalea sp. P007]
MQKFLFLLMVVFLTSCELFQSKAVRTENKVQEDLLAIDWNDVDSYPLFDTCDENAPKSTQRSCFQENMFNYFSSAFSDAQFEVDTDINETLHVDFKIDEHGFITILEIEENVKINELLPGFNAEISSRLNDLTTVAPALKQGNPVSMKFRLPLVLNTTN